MKKIYCCLGLVLLSQVYGQNVAWQRDVKSSTQDILSHVVTTIDGQILVGGSSIKPADVQSIGTNQNNGYDYHIVKIDQQGSKLWEKYYSGNGHDFLNKICASQEGGFLLVGSSSSSNRLDKNEKSYGKSDLWIIKIDENGNQEWQKTIGTKQADDARFAVQSTDLGYWVAGTTNDSCLSHGQKDVFLVKLDTNSKNIHQYILGGGNDDEIETMIPTKDGGVLLGIYSKSNSYENTPKKELSTEEFIMAARHSVFVKEDLETMKQKKEDYKTSFYAKQSQGFGNGDYWIVKLDRTGKIEWEKTFGGKDDDHVRSLSLTDTGFLIGGESRSESSGTKKSNNKEGTDLWLIAIDEKGDEQWQKSYDFGIRDILMSQNRINTRDNKTKGFLIGGYTEAEGQKKKNDESFWMLYVDNTGEEIWRKYVEGDAKKNQERLAGVTLSRDGSYILAGTSADQLGEENWKIVKLKDSQVEDLLENKNIQIYPNPVKDYCYVEIGVEFSEADLQVYDMTGKLVQQTKTKNKITKLSTSNLPQGTYIINAQTNNKQNQKLTTKIIKL